MKRFLPQTLAGQMIVLLLLALAASQVLSFWFFFDERRVAVRAAAHRQVISRTASIVRLLTDTPLRLHDQIISSASTRRLRFWLSDVAVANAEADGEDERAVLLKQRLQAELPSGISGVYVEIEDDAGIFLRRPHWRLRERDEHHEHFLRPLQSEPPFEPGDRRAEPRFHRFGLTVSVRLPDSRWLNAETVLLTPPLTWAFPSFAAMAVMAVALIVIVIVMVRRLTGPMNRLATAADRLGRGEAVEPLRAEGPSDVRRTIRAFDRMRDRLQRFVQDRTRMLAAVSHDLRTPLTTLRLRTEFIDDTETKEKFLATIDEMNAMVEAALAFAREEAAQEDTWTVDLTALVESVCSDLSDLGNDVSFTPGERMPYACRPVGLKRAVRNIVENAVRYGHRARVALTSMADGYRITVDDDGPGIPERSLEQVFEPFLRLDPSRNTETGGIGLGLSIVRSIARSHGGDVVLGNRQGGGLQATIILPID